MQAMLPDLSRASAALPDVLPPIGPRRARVALFLGCVGDALYPETTAATARVLQQNGCEVVIPRGQACCGAIHYHSGVEGPALDLARRNLAAFDPGGFDAIIVNAAGCGAMLKDYAHLLPAAEHAAAERFVARVKDISEFLVALGPIAPKHSLADEGDLSRCLPSLPRPAGPVAAPPVAGDDSRAWSWCRSKRREICCGAAGTYNLTQPEMSERLGRRKMDFIAATGAERRRHGQRRLHPPDRPQDQGAGQPDEGGSPGRSAGPGLSGRCERPSASRAITLSINRPSRGAASRPASRTSSWVIGTPRTPAAMFVTRAKARTSMPAWRATIASGTVDMPTTSAPRVGEHPDLGGRLVARAGQAGVDAGREAQPEPLGLLPRKRPQRAGVDLGHVGEAHAEPVVVGSAERVGTDQVQMVGETDEVARPQRRVDAAGGRGQDQGRRRPGAGAPGRGRSRRPGRGLRTCETGLARSRPVPRRACRPGDSRDGRRRLAAGKCGICP